jgi:hypothetical protein
MSLVQRDAVLGKPTITGRRLLCHPDWGRTSVPRHRVLPPFYGPLTKLRGPRTESTLPARSRPWPPYGDDDP